MPSSIKLDDAEAKDISSRYSSVTTIVNNVLYLQRPTLPNTQNSSQNDEEKANFVEKIDLKIEPVLVSTSITTQDSKNRLALIFSV